ncbi:hypothetical protein G6011_05052 [Alternaria panax]|uniref:Uncharacterized protein n=1 Tax=Alternaria panax TaxID=48097 RepID=A0AAD4I7Y6_9PLEO|nr:hypothetical protein G6011_05052 [Alternaria panax]
MASTVARVLRQAAERRRVRAAVFWKYQEDCIAGCTAGLLDHVLPHAQAVHDAGGGVGRSGGGEALDATKLQPTAAVVEWTAQVGLVWGTDAADEGHERRRDWLVGSMVDSGPGGGIGQRAVEWPQHGSTICK